jgi:3-dehydroshikimate dehydratase
VSLLLDRVGLCSVTLRALSAEEVVDTAVRAGLHRIEWGADVHAPPVDTDRLRAVREISLERGMVVSSYGSYWRAGTHPDSDAQAVVKAAEAIGAPRIRIWAGQVGTEQADEDVWARTVDATRVCRPAAGGRVDVGASHYRCRHPGLPLS